MTSRNQRSFSKQEREPWERGCTHESTISDIDGSLSANYSKSVGVAWYALRTLFQVNFREYLSTDLLLVCKDKLKSNWLTGSKDWRTLPGRSRSSHFVLFRTYSKAWKQDSCERQTKNNQSNRIGEKTHVPLTSHDNKETIACLT